MEVQYEKDNKERVPYEHYLEEYAAKDPREMAKRTNLPYDSDRKVFSLRLLGMEYEVTWPDFQVARVKVEDHRFSPLEEMNAAKILVMRHLLEGCEVPSTGKYLTYREVPWGELYYRQFQGRCIMRLAFSYGNRPENFCSAMETLGAAKINMGDAGYEVEILNGFYARFAIWSGDDEFPPSAQILFSDNFPAAFHTEALAVIGDITIGTLKKL